MHCATCFQTAEEGSKYCSSCRQAREGGGAAWELPQAGSAWGVVPEPPIWKPEQDAAALLASAAWSEGASWSPPPKTATESMAASAMAIGLAEPEPPRPQVQSSSTKSVEHEPDFLANPFGEPSDVPLAFTSVDSPVDAPTVPVSVADPVLGAATFVATSATGVSSDPWIEETGPGTSPPQDSEEVSSITVISSRPRDSGLNPLLLVMVGGLFLVCLLAFGKVVKDSMDESPVSAVTPASQTGGDAERFLLGAKGSMEAKDYELAASQLKKAIQELETSGAAETEIAAANVLLAQALLQQGKAAEAKALLAEAGGDSEQARKLSAQVEKTLRQQAESLMAQSETDLRAGNIVDALEGARAAEKLMRSSGGSPEQVQRAKSLLARAMKADAARGLPRTAQAAPEVEVQNPPPLGAELRRPRRTVTVYPPRPRARVEERVARVSPEPGFPKARQRREQEQLDPNSLPMAAAMRGRRRGTSGPAQIPQAPLPQEPQTYPQQQPEAGQPQAPAQGQGGYVPEQSSRRSRRGSDDVLPGYNSGQGGGSVY